MRKTLVRLAGLSAVASAVAIGTSAPGQTGLGIVPQAAPGQLLPAAQSAYTITPQAGPWMICVASYSGPTSQAMAEELAQEIRTQFRLPAFIFNRSEEEKRKERERIAQIRAAQQKYLVEHGAKDAKLPVKTVRIEDQYAILVGGPYKDDVAARKALDGIRKLEPSRKLQGDAYVADDKGKVLEVQAVNPFRSAFVCRNPSIPFEKPAADNKPDPRLKEYNADEKYSLLKCPKPFTLVIKSYQGASVVQAQSASPPSVIDKIGLGKKVGDLLNANAKQAHELADVLRKLGFEAFVLNTESNSYVTIGGFDADDPRLVQMQEAFVREMNKPTSGVSQLHLRAQFFAQPMPMPVPQVK